MANLKKRRAKSEGRRAKSEKRTAVLCGKLGTTLTITTIVTDARARYSAERRLFSRAMANLFEPPRYIAVEGPIRVGKSTLCQVIAETLHAQRISEPEHNPFLRPFYDGEPGAAFQAQFAFL